MKKRLTAYLQQLDELLAAGGEQDWQELRQEHLTQLAFFQHERLVHLLVTLAFALGEIVAALFTALAFSWAGLALCAAIATLLIPYLFHYYALENGVQKMYAQYDKLTELLHNSEE